MGGNEDAITFWRHNERCLSEEVPDAGGFPGLAGFRNSKVFSTNRNLPGVVTALSVGFARLTWGAVTLPGASYLNLQSLPGVSLLPVSALFTRGRS